MKFYTTTISAPNPRAIEILLKLKKMDIETQKIDIIKGENRTDEFKKINPASQLPCIVTDDGTVIAETLAIAEYLDEIQPDPCFTGKTAEERAETRMRVRQMDYWIFAPIINSFRHSVGKDFFKGRINIYEDLAAPSQKMGQEGLGWLNKQMAGKKYLCGDRLTYADTIFFGMLEFAERAGQKLDPAHANLIAYMDRLRAIPEFGE